MFNNFKFKSEKSILKSIVYLVLSVKLATSGPPIGPILGQCGIPAAPFCKEFNERTKLFNDNIKVRVKIYIFINGEYNFDIFLASDYFFLKNSIDLSKGASKPGYIISDSSFKKLSILNIKPKYIYITPYIIYEYILYKNFHNIIKKKDIYYNFLKLSHSTKSIGILTFTDAE